MRNFMTIEVFQQRKPFPALEVRADQLRTLVFFVFFFFFSGKGRQNECGAFLVFLNPF